MNSSRFTATKDLISNNPDVRYWQFQVVYLLVDTTIGASSINFIVNSAPRPGNCLTAPQDGTTSIVFTITCSDWFDSNGIKDYSFYSEHLNFPKKSEILLFCFLAWTDDRSNLVMIGYTTLTTIDVRMLIGDLQSSLLHLTYDAKVMARMSNLIVSSLKLLGK
jgi:hypothetical protein